MGILEPLEVSIRVSFKAEFSLKVMKSSFSVKVGDLLDPTNSVCFEIWSSSS